MDTSLVMDREDWHAAVHGVPKSWTWLSDWTEDMARMIFKMVLLKHKGGQQGPIAHGPLLNVNIDGRGVWRRMYVCICVDESLHFSPKVITLLISYVLCLVAPLSMGFSRQDYGSGLSCHPPGDFPNPETEPRSPAFQGGFFIIWATREAQEYLEWVVYPSSRDLPDPGIQLEFPALQADSLPAQLPGNS